MPTTPPCRSWPRARPAPVDYGCGGEVERGLTVRERAYDTRAPLVNPRLRHIAGTAWSTKRYLNIELLKDQRMRDAITA
jgi:hypothetical protein